MTPRCTMPGCPVRYYNGADRPCADHRGDDGEFAERAVAMGIDVTPGEHRAQRDDGDEQRDHGVTRVTTRRCPSLALRPPVTGGDDHPPGHQ